MSWAASTIAAGPTFIASWAKITLTESRSPPTGRSCRAAGLGVLDAVACVDPIAAAEAATSTRRSCSAGCVAKRGDQRERLERGSGLAARRGEVELVAVVVLSGQQRSHRAVAVVDGDDRGVRVPRSSGRCAWAARCAQSCHCGSRVVVIRRPPWYRVWIAASRSSRTRRTGPVLVVQDLARDVGNHEGTSARPLLPRALLDLVVSFFVFLTFRAGAMSASSISLSTTLRRRSAFPGWRWGRRSRGRDQSCEHRGLGEGEVRCGWCRSSNRRRRRSRRRRCPGRSRSGTARGSRPSCTSPPSAGRARPPAACGRTSASGSWTISVFFTSCWVIVEPPCTIVPGNEVGQERASDRFGVTPCVRRSRGPRWRGRPCARSAGRRAA